jgi:GTP-binding protein
VIPIVGIVGRPNVGKSTLFNRLVGASMAIVDDQPGVTRDRNYGDAFLHGRHFTLVDTGGLDPEAEDGLARGILTHVMAAIEEADAVLCILDGASEVTEADSRVVQMLRKIGKPVVYVANKVDGTRQSEGAYDIYSLGVPDLLFISALHGRGIGDLQAALVEALPSDNESAAPTAEEGVTRLAIFGRPNAGKSSLCNRLTGSERSLVDSTPGTTRDPVDTRFTYNGQIFHIVDTAGIRRRSHIDLNTIEAVSVMRAIRAMEKADVAIVLCDAHEGVTEQDARLLGLCVDRGRAVVLGINKCDLVDRASRRTILENCRTALHFAPWVPLVPVSALTGQGVDELMRVARNAYEQFHRRIATAELNRFMEQVLAKHAPPTHGGKAPRIYYITQVSSAPPMFVGMSNAPDHITQAYKRYVSNQIRKNFGFDATPLIVKFRSRDAQTK